MSILLKPTALVGAISCVIFSNPLWAEDDASTRVNVSNKPKTEVQKLAPLVVTASRNAQNLAQTPARVTVIDQASIEQSPISSLPELLKRDASLNVVQSGGLGQQTSIFVRGTNSSHVLILKDGASLNTALDGGANSPFLDLSDAGQIEVYKGPASVQYGSDAIGGVVQIRSAIPEKTSVFQTIELAENNTYKAVTGADLTTDQGFYSQLRLQRLESDGTPVTNKDPNRAAYDQKGYSAKVGYSDQQAQFSLENTQNEGRNQYYGGTQDFINQLLNATGGYQLSDLISAHFRYTQNTDRILPRSYNDYFVTLRDEYEAYATLHLSPTQNLLLGSTINNATVKSLSIDGLKKSLDTTGYYLQHQFNSDSVNTQLGVRVEDNQTFGAKTVGQAAASWKLTDLTRVYANVGSAFKAPTGNQLYYKYEDATYGNTYGNPNLKPEQSVSYEIGLDQQLSQNLLATGSIYRTDIKNLIEYSFGFPDSTYYNVSQAKIEGIELGLNWQREQYFVRADYAYSKAQNAETDLDLVRRPRQTLSLGIGLENENYGLSAQVLGKSNSKISNSASSKSLSGYATVDVSGYWNANDYLKLFMNLRNLGDVKYATANYSGDENYINPGRVASLGLTVRY